MANVEAYQAMVRKAEEVGWPTACKTDLTKHDKERLSKDDAPQRFIWCLRDAGTFLFDALDEGTLAELVYNKRCNAGKYRLYAWRGEPEMVEVNTEMAIALLDQWDAEDFPRLLKDTPLCGRKVYVRHWTGEWLPGECTGYKLAETNDWWPTVSYPECPFERAVPVGHIRLR